MPCQGLAAATTALRPRQPCRTGWPPGLAGDRGPAPAAAAAAALPRGGAQPGPGRRGGALPEGRSVTALPLTSAAAAAPGCLAAARQPPLFTLIP